MLQLNLAPQNPCHSSLFAGQPHDLDRLPPASFAFHGLGLAVQHPLEHRRNLNPNGDPHALGYDHLLEDSTEQEVVCDWDAAVAVSHC